MNEKDFNEQLFLKTLDNLELEFAEEELVLEEIKVQFSRTESRPRTTRP